MDTLDGSSDRCQRIGDDGGKRAIGASRKCGKRLQISRCRECRFRTGRGSGLLVARWRSAMSLGRQCAYLRLPRRSSVRLRASFLRIPDSPRVRLRGAPHIRLRCRPRVRLRSLWRLLRRSADSHSFLSTGDGLRQSRPVSLGLACVVVGHEPPGSWRAAGLGRAFPKGRTTGFAAAPATRLPRLRGLSQRLLALLDHHVVVIGVVGELQPQVLVGAKRFDRLPVLLEILVLGADLEIDLVGGLEAGV